MANYTQECYFKHAQEFPSRDHYVDSDLNKSLDQAAESYNEQMQRATWNNHCCPDCEAIPLNLIPPWGTVASLITLQPFLLQLEPAPAETHPITTLHFSTQIKRYDTRAWNLAICNAVFGFQHTRNLFCFVTYSKLCLLVATLSSFYFTCLENLTLSQEKRGHLF